MRRILWTCILAAQLAAQTATTITGSFVGATGTPQTGFCTFTPTQSSSVAGPYYVTGPAARCSIVAGALVGANGTGACALMPTDGLLSRPYWMECWIDQRNPAGVVVRSVSQGRAQANVPTSDTPLDIEDIVVGYMPLPPNTSVQWHQIAGKPAIRPAAVAMAVDATSYSDGFVSLTNGSTSVVGTGTAWTSAMTGRWLYTLPCMGIYRFTYVDATDGTLDRPYTCATTNGNGTRYTLTQSTYVAGGVGTTGVTVQCYDAQVPATRMGPANVLVYANYDVEILWRLAKTGYCVLSP